MKTPRAFSLVTVAAANDTRASAAWLLASLREVEERGRAIAAFAMRVRERGDVAVTEEREDLPRLRLTWLALRDALRSRAAA